MQIIPNLRRSQFIRHNAVFFIGSLAVGALNYLYYPVLGRLLNPLSFGEVQVLVSLYLQLNIFLTVFGLVTANIAANYVDEAKRNRVIFELERIALAVSALLLVVSFVLGPTLQSFFHFSSSWPFVILALAVAVNVPTTLRTSYVCGQHKFGKASIANLLVATAKIIFSAGLVIVGLGTVGAIWGVVAAQFVALCYITYWAHKLGLHRQPAKQLLSKLDFRILAPELKYAAIVLVCSLIITLQFSIDILIVKHYFDAHTAGLYAGIATVARIIFFVTGSISQVLMPSVKLSHTALKNQRLLLKSLALLSIVGLPALLIFWLVPGQIVKLLMGNQYLVYAQLLPTLSLTIFIISVVNLVISYYMALRRSMIMLVLIFGGGLTYTLMVINHGTLLAVITNLLIGSSSMLFFVGAMALWPHVYKQKMIGATS